MTTHFSPSRYLELSNGGYTLVSVSDYDALAEYRWRSVVEGLSGTKKNRFPKVYVVRREGNRQVRLHRQILTAPSEVLVDHINGNGLDNRRENLRTCTHAENSRNRTNKSGSASQFKGVTWHRRQERWQARITADGDRRFLGMFDDEVEAALAYDRAALEMFGEFAVLNFSTRGVAVSDIPVGRRSQPSGTAVKRSK